MHLCINLLLLQLFRKRVVCVLYTCAFAFRFVCRQRATSRSTTPALNVKQSDYFKSSVHKPKIHNKTTQHSMSTTHTHSRNGFIMKHMNRQQQHALWKDKIQCWYGPDKVSARLQIAPYIAHTNILFHFFLHLVCLWSAFDVDKALHLNCCIHTWQIKHDRSLLLHSVVVVTVVCTQAQQTNIVWKSNNARVYSHFTVKLKLIVREWEKKMILKCTKHNKLLYLRRHRWIRKTFF